MLAHLEDDSISEVRSLQLGQTQVEVASSDISNPALSV